MILGKIDSAVEQTVSITDFSARNGLDVHSAGHSYHTDLTADQVEEIVSTWTRTPSRALHWFWFSLNESDGPFTFPAVTPPDRILGEGELR